jgi:hypothetical protein
LKQVSDATPQWRLSYQLRLRNFISAAGRICDADIVIRYFRKPALSADDRRMAMQNTAFGVEIGVFGLV